MSEHTAQEARSLKNNLKTLRARYERNAVQLGWPTKPQCLHNVNWNDRESMLATIEELRIVIAGSDQELADMAMAAGDLVNNGVPVIPVVDQEAAVPVEEEAPISQASIDTVIMPVEENLAMHRELLDYQENQQPKQDGLSRRGEWIAWLFSMTVAFSLGFLLTYGVGNRVLIGGCLLLVFLFGKTWSRWVTKHFLRHPGPCLYLLGMGLFAAQVLGIVNVPFVVVGMCIVLTLLSHWFGVSTEQVTVVIEHQ